MPVTPDVDHLRETFELQWFGTIMHVRRWRHIPPLRSAYPHRIMVEIAPFWSIKGSVVKQPVRRLHKGHHHMRGSNDEPDKNPLQFSLRTMFGVLLAAAILMGLAVFFRGSRYFHVFWSPHALVAALPILGVLGVHATAVINERRLAVVSLAIYGVALATPALRLASDLALGCFAFLASFFGIALFSDWGSTGEHFWYPIACTMGALANVSYIVGYVSFLTFVRWRKGIDLARWSSTLGACLSLSVILPLALSTELNGVYLGYGLWAASLLALALGSWRAAIKT